MKPINCEINIEYNKVYQSNIVKINGIEFDVIYDLSGGSIENIELKDKSLQSNLENIGVILDESKKDEFKKELIKTGIIKNEREFNSYFFQLKTLYNIYKNKDKIVKHLNAKNEIFYNVLGKGLSNHNFSKSELEDIYSLLEIFLHGYSYDNIRNKWLTINDKNEIIKRYFRVKNKFKNLILDKDLENIINFIDYKYDLIETQKLPVNYNSNKIINAFGTSTMNNILTNLIPQKAITNTNTGAVGPTSPGRRKNFIYRKILSLKDKLLQVNVWLSNIKNEFGDRTPDVIKLFHEIDRQDTINELIYYAYKSRLKVSKSLQFDETLERYYLNGLLIDAYNKNNKRERNPIDIQLIEYSLGIKNYNRPITQNEIDELNKDFKNLTEYEFLSKILYSRNGTLTYIKNKIIEVLNERISSKKYDVNKLKDAVSVINKLSTLKVSFNKKNFQDFIWNLKTDLTSIKLNERTDQEVESFLNSLLLSYINLENDDTSSQMFEVVVRVANALSDIELFLKEKINNTELAKIAELMYEYDKALSITKNPLTIDDTLFEKIVKTNLPINFFEDKNIRDKFIKIFNIYKYIEKLDIDNIINNSNDYNNFQDISDDLINSINDFKNNRLYGYPNNASNIQRPPILGPNTVPPSNVTPVQPTSPVSTNQQVVQQPNISSSNNSQNLVSTSISNVNNTQQQTQISTSPVNNIDETLAKRTINEHQRLIDVKDLIDRFKHVNFLFSKVINEDEKIVIEKENGDKTFVYVLGVIEAHNNRIKDISSKLEDILMAYEALINNPTNITEAELYDLQKCFSLLIPDIIDSIDFYLLDPNNLKSAEDKAISSYIQNILKLDLSSMYTYKSILENIKNQMYAFHKSLDINTLNVRTLSDKLRNIYRFFYINLNSRYNQNIENDIFNNLIDLSLNIKKVANDKIQNIETYREGGLKKFGINKHHSSDKSLHNDEVADIIINTLIKLKENVVLIANNFDEYLKTGEAFKLDKFLDFLLKDPDSYKYIENFEEDFKLLLKFYKSLFEYKENSITDEDVNAFNKLINKLNNINLGLTREEYINIFKNYNILIEKRNNDRTNKKITSELFISKELSKEEDNILINFINKIKEYRDNLNKFKTEYGDFDTDNFTEQLHTLPVKNKTKGLKFVRASIKRRTQKRIEEEAKSDAQNHIEQVNNHSPIKEEEIGESIQEVTDEIETIEEKENDNVKEIYVTNEKLQEENIIDDSNQNIINETNVLIEELKICDSLEKLIDIGDFDKLDELKRKINLLKYKVLPFDITKAQIIRWEANIDEANSIIFHREGNDRELRNIKNDIINFKGTDKELMDLYKRYKYFSSDLYKDKKYYKDKLDEIENLFSIKFEEQYYSHQIVQEKTIIESVLEKIKDIKDKLNNIKNNKLTDVSYQNDLENLNKYINEVQLLIDVIDNNIFNLSKDDVKNELGTLSHELTKELNNKFNSYKEYKQNQLSKLPLDQLLKNGSNKYYQFVQNKYSIRSNDLVFRPFPITNPSILKDLMLQDENIKHFLFESGIQVTPENIDKAKEFIAQNFGTIYAENNIQFQKTELKSLINFDNNPNNIINVLLEYSKIFEIKTLNSFLNFKHSDNNNTNAELIYKVLDKFKNNKELSKALLNVVNLVSNHFNNITKSSSVDFTKMNLILSVHKTKPSEKTYLYNEVEEISQNFGIDINELLPIAELLTAMRYMTNMSVDVMQKYANSGYSIDDYLVATVEYAISYINELNNEYANNFSDIYNNILITEHPIDVDGKRRNVLPIDLSNLVVLQRAQYYFLVNPLIKNINVGNENSTLAQNVLWFHNELFGEFKDKNTKFFILSTTKDKKVILNPTIGLSITQMFHTFFMNLYNKQTNKEEALTKGVNIPTLMRQGFIPFIANENVKLNFNFGNNINYEYQFKKGFEDTLFFNNQHFDKNNTTRQELLYNQLVNKKDLTVTMRLGVAYYDLEEALKIDEDLRFYALQIPHALKIEGVNGYKVVSQGFLEADKLLNNELNEEYRHQTIYVIKLYNEKENKEVELHLTKRLLKSDFSSKKADFSFKAFTKGQLYLKSKLSDFVKIQMPVFALMDVKKDKNGNNKIFEIVNNYHLANYFSNFQKELDEGKEVLIDVSVNDYEQGVGLGSLTASYPINSIGTNIRRNHFSSESNNIQYSVDEIEELDAIDDEEELKTSLSTIGDKTEAELEENELIQRQTKKIPEDSGKKFLRIVNKLDFDKEFREFKGTEAVYFVDYTGKRDFYNDSGNSLAGALGVPLIKPDGTIMEYNEFSRKTTEYRKEINKLRLEINKLYEEINKIEKNKEIQDKERYSKLLRNLSELSDKMNKLTKEYNNLIDEYKSENTVIDINPNNVDNDFINLTLLTTQYLLNINDGFDKSFARGYPARVIIAKELFASLNEKLRDTKKEESSDKIIQLKDGTRIKKDIVDKLKNAIENNRKNTDNFIIELQDILGKDFNSLLDNILEKQIEEVEIVDDKKKINKINLSEENKLSIKKDIYYDIYKEIKDIVEILSIIEGGNNHKINPEYLGKTLSIKVSNINIAHWKYPKVLMYYSLTQKDNVLSSIKYFEVVLKRDENDKNELLYRFKANVNINYNLQSTEEKIYKGKELVKDKEEIKEIKNSLAGRIANSENNKSRYILQLGNYEEIIPIRGISLSFIQSKLDDYLSNKDNLNKYDIEATNKLIDKTIDIIIDFYEKVIYNDEKIEDINKANIINEFLEGGEIEYDLLDENGNLLSLEEAKKKIEELRKDEEFRERIASKLLNYISNINEIDGITHSQLYDYFYNISSYHSKKQKHKNVIVNVLYNLFIIPSTASYESEVDGNLKPSYQNKNNSETLQLNFRKSKHNEVGYYIDGKKIEREELKETLTTTKQEGITIKPVKTQPAIQQKTIEQPTQTTPIVEQPNIELTLPKENIETKKVLEEQIISIEEPKKEKIKIKTGIRGFKVNNVELDRFETIEEPIDEKEEIANKKQIEEIASEIISALDLFVDKKANKSKSHKELSSRIFDKFIDISSNIVNKYNYKYINELFNKIKDEEFKKKYIELFKWYSDVLGNSISAHSETLMFYKEITEQQKGKVWYLESQIKNLIRGFNDDISENIRNKVKEISKILDDNKIIENNLNIIFFIKDTIEKIRKKEPIIKEEKELFNRIIDEINRNKYYENEKLLDRFNNYGVDISYEEIEVDKEIEEKEEEEEIDTREYLYNGAIVKDKDGNYTIERNKDSYYKNLLDNPDNIGVFDLINVIGNIENVGLVDAVIQTISVLKTINTKYIFNKNYNILYKYKYYNDYSNLLFIKYIYEGIEKIENEEIKKQIREAISKKYSIFSLKDLDNQIEDHGKDILNVDNELFYDDDGTEIEELITDTGSYTKEEYNKRLLEIEKHIIEKSAQIAVLHFLGYKGSNEEIAEMYTERFERITGYRLKDDTEVYEYEYMLEKFNESNTYEINDIKFKVIREISNNKKIEFDINGTIENSINNIKNSLITLIGEENINFNVEEFEKEINNLKNFLDKNLLNIKLNSDLIETFDTLIDKIKTLINDDIIFKNIILNIFSLYKSENINILIERLKNKDIRIKYEDTTSDKKEIKSKEKKDIIESDESIVSEQADAPTFVKKSPVELISEVVHNFFKENVHVNITLENINIKNILEVIKNVNKTQKINIDNIDENIKEQKGVKLEVNNSTIDEVLFSIINHGQIDANSPIDFTYNIILNIKKLLIRQNINNIELSNVHANILVQLIRLYNKSVEYNNLINKKDLTKEEKETLSKLKAYHIPVIEGLRSMAVSFYETDNINEKKSNKIGLGINEKGKSYWTADREKTLFRPTISPNNKIASVSYPSLFTDTIKKINERVENLKNIFKLDYNNLHLSRIVNQGINPVLNSSVNEIEIVQRFHLFYKNRKDIYAVLNTSVSDTPYTIKTDKLVGGELSILSEIDNIFSFIESLKNSGINLLNENGNIYFNKDSEEGKIIQRLTKGYHYIETSDGKLRINPEMFDTKYNKDISLVNVLNEEGYNKNRNVLELFIIGVDGNIKITEKGKLLYKLYNKEQLTKDDIKNIKDIFDTINKYKNISNLQFLNKLLEQDLFNKIALNYRLSSLEIFEDILIDEEISKDTVNKSIIKTVQNVNNYFVYKLKNNLIDNKKLDNYLLLTSYLLNTISTKDKNLHIKQLKQIEDFLKQLTDDEYNELVNVLYNNSLPNIENVSELNQQNLNEKEKLIINTLLENVLNYKLSKTYRLKSKDNKKGIDPLNKNGISKDNVINSIEKLKQITNEMVKDDKRDEFYEFNYTLPGFVTADLDLSYMLKYLVHSESIANSTYSDGGDMNVKLYDNKGNRIPFPLVSFSKRLQQHYTPGSRFVLMDSTRIEGDLFINKGQKRVLIKKVNEKEINTIGNETLNKIKAKVNDGQGEMLVDEMIGLVASKGLVDLNHIKHIKSCMYSYRKFNMLKVLFNSISYIYGTEELYELLERFSTEFSSVGLENIEKTFNKKDKNKFNEIKDLYVLVDKIFKGEEKIDIENNDSLNFYKTQLQNNKNKLENLKEKKKSLSEEIKLNKENKADKSIIKKLETDLSNIEKDIALTDKEIKKYENKLKLFTYIYNEFNNFIERYNNKKEQIDELNIDYYEGELISDLYALSFIKNYLPNRKIGAYGNSNVNMKQNDKEINIANQNVSIKSSFGVLIPALLYDVNVKENSEEALYHEVLKHNKKVKQEGGNNYITFIVNDETIKRFKSSVLPSMKKEVLGKIDEYAIGIDENIFRDMIEGKSSYNNTTTPIGSKTIQLSVLFKDKKTIETKHITFTNIQTKRIKNILSNVDETTTPKLFNLVNNNKLNIHDIGRAMNNAAYLMSYKLYKDKLKELGLEKDVIEYSKFIEKMIEANSDIESDEDINVILSEYREYESYYKSYNDSVFKIESLLQQIETKLFKKKDIDAIADGEKEFAKYDIENKKHLRQLAISLLTNKFELYNTDSLSSIFQDNKLIYVDNSLLISINNEDFEELSKLIEKEKKELIKKAQNSTYIKIRERLDDDIAYLPLYDKIIASLTKQLIKSSMHLKVNGGFEVNFSMSDGIKYKDNMKFSKEFKKEIVEDYIEKHKDKELKIENYEKIFKDISSEEMFEIICENRNGKYTDIIFVSPDMKVGSIGKDVITADMLANEDRLEEVVGITVRIPQAGRETQAPARIVGVYPFGITGMATSHPYTVSYKGEDFDFDKLAIQINYVKGDKQKQIEKETKLIEKLLNIEISDVIVEELYKNYTVEELMNIYSKLAYISHNNNEHFEAVKSGTNYGYFEKASEEVYDKIGKENSNKSFSHILEFNNESIVAGKGLGMAVLMSGMLSKTFLQYLVNPNIEFNNDMKLVIQSLLAQSEFNQEDYFNLINENNFSSINSLIQVCLDASKLLANSALNMTIENYGLYLWILANNNLIKELKKGEDYTNDDVIKLMLDINNNKLFMSAYSKRYNVSEIKYINNSNVGKLKSNGGESINIHDKILEIIIRRILTEEAYKNNKNLDKIEELVKNTLKNEDTINHFLVQYALELEPYKEYITLDTKYSNQDFINRLNSNMMNNVLGIDSDGNIIIKDNLDETQLLETLKFIKDFINNVNSINKYVQNFLSIYSDYNNRRPNIIDKKQIISIMSGNVTKNYNPYVYDMAMFEEIHNNYLLNNIYESKRIILADYISFSKMQYLYPDYKYIEKLEDAFKELTLYKMIKEYTYNNTDKQLSPIEVITGNHLDEKLVSNIFDVITNYKFVIGDNEYSLNEYLELETNKLEKIIKEEYETKSKISFDVKVKYRNNCKVVYKKDIKNQNEYERFKKILYHVISSDEELKQKIREKLRNNKVSYKEEELNNIYNYIKRLYIGNLYLDNSEFVPTAVVKKLFEPININEQDKIDYQQFLFNKFIYDISFNNSVNYLLDVSKKKKENKEFTSEDVLPSLRNNLEKIFTKLNLPNISTEIKIEKKSYEYKGFTFKRYTSEYGSLNYKYISTPTYKGKIFFDNIFKTKEETLNVIRNFNNKSYNNKIDDTITLLKYFANNISNIQNRKYYLEVIESVKENILGLDFGYTIEILEKDNNIKLYADTKQKKIYISQGAINNIDKLGEEFIEEIMHVIFSSTYVIDKKLSKDYNNIKKEIINNMKMFIDNKSDFDLIDKYLLNDFNSLIKNNELIDLILNIDTLNKISNDSNHQYYELANTLKNFYNKISKTHNTFLDRNTYYDIGKSFLKMLYGMSDIEEFIPNMIPASKYMNIFMKTNILEYVKVNDKEELYMNERLNEYGWNLEHSLLRHATKVFNNDMSKKLIRFTDSLGLLNNEFSKKICD